MTASRVSPRALNERYGKLDILVGNAALGASSSPLDHFEPKEWDDGDGGQRHRQLASDPRACTRCCCGPTPAASCS